MKMIHIYALTCMLSISSLLVAGEGYLTRFGRWLGISSSSMQLTEGDIARFHANFMRNNPTSRMNVSDWHEVLNKLANSPEHQALLPKAIELMKHNRISREDGARLQQAIYALQTPAVVAPSAPIPAHASSQSSNGAAVTVTGSTVPAGAPQVGHLSGSNNSSVMPAAAASAAGAVSKLALIKSWAAKLATKATLVKGLAAVGVGATAYYLLKKLYAWYHNVPKRQTAQPTKFKLPRSLEMGSREFESALRAFFKVRYQNNQQKYQRAITDQVYRHRFYKHVFLPHELARAAKIQRSHA